MIILQSPCIYPTFAQSFLVSSIFGPQFNTNITCNHVPQTDSSTWLLYTTINRSLDRNGDNT